jgi:putative FmdB family regulatory protein
MPTYEYECSSCHIRFEKFQSIKDDPLSKCPECNGPVKRLIGAGVGIIFKGSGFYTTDYKKKSSISDTNNNKSNNGSSRNKAKETKSETKTGTKKGKESGKASSTSST